MQHGIPPESVPFQNCGQNDTTASQKGQSVAEYLPNLPFFSLQQPICQSFAAE
jgi:hypothetical protein